jgi:tRNA(fMet)-specific endonuclease VapC
LILMLGDFLLDTNIVIAIFADEAKVLRKLRRATVFLPVTVAGELIFGALKSTRVEKNVARIDEFVSANSVLFCDLETAQEYGKIKAELRRKGRPLPENDIWIAAIAVQFDLTLISRDDHFREIDDLKLTKW